MDVQRKLEILADANLARGIPQKALSFIVLSDHAAFPRWRAAEGAVQAEGCATAIWGFDHKRHCEQSEAIHRAAKKE
jgi:hypothetical protein